MVELQPSKLITWVRFPSPAPLRELLTPRVSFIVRENPQIVWGFSIALAMS